MVTGVSGSGKSTLAFDIIFAEGQRRYLESLNAYARQFVQPATRPDVDAIHGIPPTVAIEQRTSRGGRRSTVATLARVRSMVGKADEFFTGMVAPSRSGSGDGLAGEANSTC